MDAAYEIKYITHDAIDKHKWDACIEAAANGLIYGYSWWLDAMTPSWDALVWNDYKAVMPLTGKKKWGIRYVCQPFFTQQLGVFSTIDLPEGLITAFLQKAMDHFKFGEIFLNFSNNTLTAAPHKNYILSLNRNYEIICKDYRPNLKKKINAVSLKYTVGNDYNKTVALYKAIYGERIPHVKERDYDRLRAALKIAALHKKLLIREVYDQQDELLAIILCLYDTKRIYLLLPSTSEAGRKVNAQHFLINKMIEEFAGASLIFDFEGSDIPGVAQFYEGFGSTNQPYFFYRWNKLSWPFRLFK